MKSVGQKIRHLRTELSLSQSDLAGSEMTRAFISHLESGRSNPSMRTLAIIASRLGRPVDYFLATEDCAAAGTAALDQSLRSYDGGDYLQAVRTARAAVASLLVCDDAELLFQARIALAKGVIAQGDYEEAWPPLYDALESAVFTSQPSAVGTAMYWWGCCAYLGEEFLLAKRYFRQSMDRLSVRKSDRGMQLRAQLFYGSCSLRLGVLDEARESYGTVYGETNSGELAHLHIDSGAGLGWVHHLSGDHRKAREVLLAVRAVSKKHQGHRLVSIDHNLSILSSHLGGGISSLRAMKRCVGQYLRQGDILSAVAMFEEMSAHQMRCKRMADARKAAQDGLDLIADRPHANLQRGRLHRMLGDIALAEGEREVGLHQAEMAIVYFQAIHAYGELEATLTLHRSLRSAMEGGGGTDAAPSQDPAVDKR